MKRLVIDASTGRTIETELSQDDVLAREAEIAAHAAAVAGQARANQLAAIDSRLTAIDVEAIRPLRAMAAGTASQFDTDKLAALEAEAMALRGQRAALASAV
ncbi:MAG: hypothetical protein FD176_72 [Rhodospirillaceae bacterium]|nr:MAG: hypothetical protein FD176_72 [Rhodospirillaceae bacterium]TNC94856.1 MAG: Uncharacterized protein FD119_2905 [Stygiobacter sp.]